MKFGTKIILGFCWFPGERACVGCLIAQDEITKDMRGYIGAVGGYNEQADIVYLINHGSKLNLSAAREFIKAHGTVVNNEFHK